MSFDQFQFQYSGVTHRVGNDQDVGLGGGLSGGLGEVADDGGVGVEEVITGHTGFARNARGDEDDLRALEAVTETGGIGIVALDNAVGVDVAEISGNTLGHVSYNPAARGN